MKAEQMIETRFWESIQLKEKILADKGLKNDIAELAGVLIDVMKNNGVIFVCGNGGSATDSLHMAGEIVGRFQKERKGYACIALNADVASITAVANDYGYDAIFARAVEACTTQKDILLGFSTSGNSKNIIEAVKKAKEIGLRTAALLGKDGGELVDLVDYPIVVPSQVTARIQEVHILIIHILCELMEEEML